MILVIIHDGKDIGLVTEQRANDHSVSNLCNKFACQDRHNERQSPKCDCKLHI